MCKCCLGSYKEEACGWPKGTVRAVIAMTVIILGIASSIVLMILLYVAEAYEAAIGVGGTITGLVGIVIGYYFGSRSAEGAAQMISHNDQQLIKSQEIARSHDRGFRRKRIRRKSRVDIEMGEILLE